MGLHGLLYGELFNKPDDGRNVDFHFRIEELVQPDHFVNERQDPTVFRILQRFANGFLGDDTEQEVHQRKYHQGSREQEYYPHSPVKKEIQCITETTH